MIVNGKRGWWIAALVGVVTLLTAGSTLALRVLNVESRDDSTAARDALRVEMYDEIQALDTRLRKIETDVATVETNVIWIRAALQDAGYRAPKQAKR